MEAPESNPFTLCIGERVILGFYPMGVIPLSEQGDAETPRPQDRGRHGSKLVNGHTWPVIHPRGSRPARARSTSAGVGSQLVGDNGCRMATHPGTGLKTWTRIAQLRKAREGLPVSSSRDDAENVSKGPYEPLDTVKSAGPRVREELLCSAP